MNTAAHTATHTPSARPPQPAAGPALTARQVDLVQRSWQQVLPAGPAVAAQFYQRLFELDPSLRPLFRHDLAAQGSKLVAALDFVVQGLHDLPARLPAVQALARRHATYGVQPGHFDTVGQALLWTLKHGLGDVATDELLGAWALAYGQVARAMQQAAWPSPGQAPEWAAQAG